MIFMHGKRATSNVLSCTETVHVEAARHARVGVQHKAPSPCTVAVQLTLHACGATQDNRYRTTDPDMHYVQVGRIPLPDFTTTHLAQLNHVGNQQTACAEEEPTMTVAELMEKLAKCNPDALVVTEDNELGFETEFEVVECPALVERNASNPFDRVRVRYVLPQTPASKGIETVVALTVFGHENEVKA